MWVGPLKSYAISHDTTLVKYSINTWMILGWYWKGRVRQSKAHSQVRKTAMKNGSFSFVKVQIPRRPGIHNRLRFKRSVSGWNGSDAAHSGCMGQRGIYEAQNIGINDYRITNWKTSSERGYCCTELYRGKCIYPHIHPFLYQSVLVDVNFGISAQYSKTCTSLTVLWSAAWHHVTQC